jgi:hypothetical protein
VELEELKLATLLLRAKGLGPAKSEVLEPENGLFLEEPENGLSGCNIS